MDAQVKPLKPVTPDTPVTRPSRDEAEAAVRTLIAWAGDEFVVNTASRGGQYFPQVSELADGRVLFTWSSADPDVDSDGGGIAARIGTGNADGGIAWAGAERMALGLSDALDAPARPRWRRPGELKPMSRPIPAPSRTSRWTPSRCARRSAAPTRSAASR